VFANFIANNRIIERAGLNANEAFFLNFIVANERIGNIESLYKDIISGGQMDLFSNQKLRTGRI